MIFSLRYPAGCSCFFLHLLFEKGEVNPARYEKKGSRKMACIMGCPAAHNNAALRELPEQEDMEIVGRKNIVVFFHTAVRLVFLCDTPDGFCLFSDGEAARKGLLFLNGISSGFLHFPDAFLHQSGVYLMDVFSPAYSGKHQYRQVTAEVFAEGLQTFQHFAGAVFCPAGKQGGGIRAVPGFSARR